MVELSKNARVLQYLAQQARRPLSTFQLQKLPYFADLLARKHMGRPVTSFDYIWYDHGPFDSDLYAAIGELESAGLADFEPARFRRHSGRLLRTKAPSPELGLTDTERYILDRVCQEYEPLSTKQLKDRAYATEPMRAVTERGLKRHRLPMEMVDGIEADRGCDLERAVAASRRVDAGNHVLATDFFDALRAQAVRGDAGANR